MHGCLPFLLKTVLSDGLDHHSSLESIGERDPLGVCFPCTGFWWWWWCSQSDQPVSRDLQRRESWALCSARHSPGGYVPTTCFHRELCYSLRSGVQGGSLAWPPGECSGSWFWSWMWSLLLGIYQSPQCFSPSAGSQEQVCCLWELTFLAETIFLLPCLLC